MAGLLALSLGSTCTRPAAEEPDAGAAPVDALVLDAGAPDGAVPTVDAQDAQTLLGDPGWFHVPALPEECEIELATYPDRVMEPLTWIADCGVGCRRWGGGANLVQADDSGDTIVVVLIAETPPDAEDPRRFVSFVDLGTGRVLAAFRDRGNASLPSGEPFCSIYGQGSSTGSLAVEVNFMDYDASGDRLERAWWTMLRAETFDPAASLRELYRSDVHGGSYASRLRLSPTHVAALFGDVPVLVGNDGSYVVPTYGTGDTSETSQLEIFDSEDLVWASWRGPTVLVRSGRGAPPTVLRSVEGEAVRGSDIRGFSSDANVLAWLEGRGYDDETLTYESVSLWTAEYGGAELIAPRRVAEVGGHASGEVGGGYYVHSEADPAAPSSRRFVFYRLSDGARATVDPSDLPENRVLYVSATDSILEAYGQLYRIDPLTLTFEAP
jgi:hypothetical protein